jgi:hypothetical protein
MIDSQKASIARHRRRIAPLFRHAEDYKSPDAIYPAITLLILA